MIFSKSFGYSLRSVLYIASLEDPKTRIRLEVIADQLNIPRHFLGKVLKRLVKEGILHSQKGPTGGFTITDKTLQTPLYRFMKITGETEQFDFCVLRLQDCNSVDKCPLHDEAELIKKQWFKLLSCTTINDLLGKTGERFVKSIAST